MISNKNFFNNSRVLPVDKFIENVLYNKKAGYYSSRTPFGKSGDFITAPEISQMFGEIIGLYIIDYWICILIRVCVHVTIIITRHDQAYSL